MRLLVLGGTVFLGRAVAAAARAAGHQVTCLARGVSGRPPAGVRFVPGDRDRADAFTGLAGERFDAVVDVSRRPAQVRRALAALADRIGHWAFVSTGNVYADSSTPGQRAADAPLLDPAPDGVDETDQEQYGPCKVACEQAVLVAVGADRAFLCRAGLIVGPDDAVDRFGYWPLRLARGGEVLAPGAPDTPVQLIDVRDLANWIVRAAGTRLAGRYDGIGAPLPLADLLDRVARGIGARPTLTWVDQEFLRDAGVAPWSGPRSLPLWLPQPEYAGFAARDVSASLAAGLRTRDLATTARDTLAWERSVAGGHQLAAGTEAADEAALLARWHGRDPS